MSVCLVIVFENVPPAASSLACASARFIALSVPVKATCLLLRMDGSAFLAFPKDEQEQAQHELDTKGVS